MLRSMEQTTPINGSQKEPRLQRILPQEKKLREDRDPEAGSNPQEKQTQEPRANTRPEAQINHKPKVKTNTGPRTQGTNDRGPNKGWVPKLV